MASKAQTAMLDTRDEIGHRADEFKHRAEETAEAAKGAMRSASDRASHLRSRIGETASGYADQALDTASDLAERGGEYARGASREMHRYAYKAEKAARRNPLATVAAALMVGVAIGYLSRGR